MSIESTINEIVREAEWLKGIATGVVGAVAHSADRAEVARAQVGGLEPEAEARVRIMEQRIASTTRPIVAGMRLLAADLESLAAHLRSAVDDVADDAAIPPAQERLLP